MSYEEFSRKPRLEREWLLYSGIISLHQKFNTIMDPIQQLIQDTQAEESVEKSLVTLLTGYYQQILATVPGLTDDQKASLQALHDSITADTATLTAAVTANTPATPSNTSGS